MKLNFICISADLQEGEPPSENVVLRATDEGVVGTIELTIENKEQQGKFEPDKVYLIPFGEDEPEPPADVTA